MARIGTRVARKRLQDTIDRLHQAVQDLRLRARLAQRGGNQELADKLYADAAETNRYLTQVCRTRKR